MDKIRKALHGQRPLSPSYEPLNTDANAHTGEESSKTDPPQPASSWLEYAIFVFLGVAMLWAWNMFLAASPYFQHRFSSSAYLLTHFLSYITFVSTITNLVSVTLLAHLQRSASYPQRIITSLCLNLVCFTLLALSTTLFRSISPEAYFAFLMLMVFTASLATGLCQNGVFAYAAGFGVPRYTQGIMTGHGIAGVLPCIAQIVSVLSVSRDDEPKTGVGQQESSKSAFVYFLTATAISFFTLFAFLYHLRCHGPSRQYKTTIETVADGVDTAQDETEEAAERKVVSMWTLFRKLRYLSLAVFLSFAITMFFPIFTQQILSIRPADTAPRLFQPDCFIPLGFLLWNAGDLAGRVITGFPRLTSLIQYPRVLFLLSILRVVFIPLYLLCNVKAKGAVVESDVFYLVGVQFLFGLSNGYLGSSCMMGAGQCVEKEEREAAGGFMGLMLVGGLTVGSLLSFLAA
ncbi:MAG: hypothetical protein Q9181_002698 [Wetmoreana brouardii]